jgi:hypothetical protein
VVGKGANRIIAVPFQSIRSSCISRHSPSRRWRETRTALNRFVPSPKINSFRQVAGELRRPTRRVVGVQLEFRFEPRDCRPSGRWSEKRTSLRKIAPFVRLWEL